MTNSRNPYEDLVGPHRVGVLDAACEFITQGGTDFAETPTTTSWGLTRLAKFVRLRNPREFEPTHAYIGIGAAGLGGNWCVAVYKEETAAPSVRQIRRIGTTGTVAGISGPSIAFGALTMTEPLVTGEYIIGMQLDEVGSNGVLERRPGEDIDYYTRIMGLGLGVPSGFPLPIGYAFPGDPGSEDGFNIFGLTQRLF